MEKMEEYIPSYIKEEIEEYLLLTEKGKCKIMKWENIKMLLRMAQINGRLTVEQTDFIMQKYNRENEK